MKKHKELEDMVPSDFEISPVWEFALDLEEEGENMVRPVTHLPVDDLGNRIVGTKVRLANGTQAWATIQNIDLSNAYKTHHLLSLSLYHNGEWEHLDRYHDYNLENYGPVAFARKLGLNIDQVFPISYDVGGCCVGIPQALAGVIESDPKEKLTRDEIYELIVGKKPKA